MDWTNSVFIPVLVAACSAIGTVLITDFVGLRRERAKLRMELDWQIRRQEWDALYSALQSQPYFSLERQLLLQSVVDLCLWVETKVEPWISDAATERLIIQRTDIEKWVADVVQDVNDHSSASTVVPTAQINQLRKDALKYVSDELARIQRQNSNLKYKSML